MPRALYPLWNSSVTHCFEERTSFFNFDPCVNGRPFHEVQFNTRDLFFSQQPVQIFTIPDRNCENENAARRQQTPQVIH